MNEQSLQQLFSVSIHNTNIPYSVHAHTIRQPHLLTAAYKVTAAGNLVCMCVHGNETNLTSDGMYLCTIPSYHCMYDQAVLYTTGIKHT